jgi:hypothetical protein
MRLPLWLTLLCAAMVILWGAYRIKLGLRSAEAEARARQRGGLFGLPRTTHVLVGVVYILMGGGLAAIALGWDPLARGRGGAPAETVPAGDAVPVEVR